MVFLNLIGMPGEKYTRAEVAAAIEKNKKIEEREFGVNHA